jgi:tRNA (guanine37-N1)-methyltransferase|tara:strand:+ start:13 stop:753 length:741 start_codon:yes stop_codon:yes gene_type:complete
MSKAISMKKIFKAKVITLFPENFPGILGIGVIGKALKNKLWKLEVIDIRKFGKGNHKKVDDTTAGGGPGMILKADVLGQAIDKSLKGVKDLDKTPIVYLSPRGKSLTQNKVKKISKGDGIILLCGRYEGVDQRVLDKYKIEEISLGDFILAGGEIAAQAVLEATIRLIPGVLGDSDSLDNESFKSDLLEFPQYTRPRSWKNIEIPDVLNSGNHKNIDIWRKDMSKKLTKKIRPDLWEKYKKKQDIK